MTLLPSCGNRFVKSWQPAPYYKWKFTKIWMKIDFTLLAFWYANWPMEFADTLTTFAICFYLYLKINNTHSYPSWSIIDIIHEVKWKEIISHQWLCKYTSTQYIPPKRNHLIIIKFSDSIIATVPVRIASGKQKKWNVANQPWFCCHY